MHVWEEEWVVWMVGLEQRGKRGVYGGWGGTRGGLWRGEGGSNLGVHFGVWKTVGLFQLECNISSEHAPTL